MKIAIALLALVMLAATASADYVVLSGVAEKDPYHAAAKAIAKHHGTDLILRFDPENPEEILPRLREIEPEHVAIVLRPEQIHVNSVRAILRMAAKVDPDPFVDFDFGYITGATAREAATFVANIVKAAGMDQPRILGRAAVSGGTGKSRRYDGTQAVGGAFFPLRNLTFVAPDGGHGRDQAFIDENLAALEGCGAVLMGGHGMPWEIGSGPRAEDVAELELFPAVAFNYACHTGVTRDWPDRQYRSGKYVMSLKQVQAKRSFALSMIRAGVTGYVAYVNPRPAGPELHTDFERVLAGATLGESRRNDYAKIALGYLGFGEPGIVPPDFEDGLTIEVAKVDPVRHMMLDGATGGILYGDPAFRPYPGDGVELPVTVSKEVADLRLRVTIRTAGQMAYLWGADPFRQFDPKTRQMAMKSYGRVEVPEGIEVDQVRIESATWGGKAIETLDPVWALETDRGSRYLHLKANYARGGRGDVVVVFLAGADLPDGRPATPPAAGPSAVGRPDAETCLRHARRCGEVVMNSLEKIETGEFYDGAAGSALFLLDLYGMTGEERWLAGGLFLLDRALEKAEGPGLYTGLAGVGQVCLEAHRVTGKPAYLEKAKACAASLGDPKGTDVISGAAGTGIFLLNLHTATGEKEHLEAATKLGNYLKKHAVREKGSARWPVAPGRPVFYYGFSHGAAGIGAFLANLGRATGDRSWDDLAEESAMFVALNTIRGKGGSWHWPKKHSAAEDAPMPITWCHGSAGIALLFLEQGRCGRADAAEAILACLKAVKHDGLGERSPARGQCHGVAGNSEILLDVGRRLGDEKAVSAAFAGGRQLMNLDGSTLAAYRPGYMTGIAGIGRFFLRLADPEKVPPAMMVRHRSK